MSESLITVLLGGVMVLGLAGVFIPVLPDISLIWAAALGYGLLVGWGRWGPWLFAGITVLAVVAAAADLWTSGAGARLGGASLWGILGGLGLGLVGLILLPPLGGLLGLLAGTFLVEYLRLRSAERALRATLGMGLGYGASFVVKLILGMMMIGAWIVWVVAG
jgi:hypothetical protein